MKLLSKRTSEILKLVVLFNFLIAETLWAAPASRLVSADRYLIKIVDRTISIQDINFQLRNLKGLSCVYDDALVVQYFGKSFIKELDAFTAAFPKEDEAVRTFMHKHEPLLLKIRIFFKMLRYSEDQKEKVSADLSKVIREGTKENKCNSEVLYKDTLKTNFKKLLEMEIYLRTRYGSQMKNNNTTFDSIRSSVDLFTDSLDKQFGHEYYW